MVWTCGRSAERCMVTLTETKCVLVIPLLYTAYTAWWGATFVLEILPELLAGAHHVSRVKLTCHREVYETFSKHRAAAALCTTILLNNSWYMRSGMGFHSQRPESKSSAAEPFKKLLTLLTTFTVMRFNLKPSQVYTVQHTWKCGGRQKKQHILFKNALFLYFNTINITMNKLFFFKQTFR